MGGGCVGPRSGTRGMLASSFAAVDTDFSAQTMINMLNPKLQSILKAHPDISKQFIVEMDKQLETVKADPEAMKALRAEMETDLKDLNAQVEKDPSMLDMIEKNLAAAASPAMASMSIVGMSAVSFITQGAPSVYVGGPRQREAFAEF